RPERRRRESVAGLAVLLGVAPAARADQVDEDRVVVVDAPDGVPVERDLEVIAGPERIVRPEARQVVPDQGDLSAEPEVGRPARWRPRGPAGAQRDPAG